MLPWCAEFSSQFEDRRDREEEDAESERKANPHSSLIMGFVTSHGDVEKYQCEDGDSDPEDQVV